MRSYIDKESNKMIFVIDDDADHFESFGKSVEYLKNKYQIKIIEYYPGGWNISYLKFEIDDIYMKLSFTDYFGGTDLQVDANLKERELEKAHKLADEIYNEIHKNKTEGDQSMFVT